MDEGKDASELEVFEMIVSFVMSASNLLKVRCCVFICISFGSTV